MDSSGAQSSAIGVPSHGHGRWEYRVWNPPSWSVSRLATRGSVDGVDERRDVYLLGADRSVNAKLRGAVALDVKHLVETRDDLQRWRPEPPVDLPLTSDQLDRLLTDLALVGHLEQWSDADLADPAGVVAAHGGRIVAAAKRRWRHRVDGVSAELACVRFAGEPHFSIAIEDDDPAAVRFAREQLDLDGPNVAMNVAAERAAPRLP